MRDNNILVRHIKLAARKLGLDFVNWRCLRTSHTTRVKLAAADVNRPGQRRLVVQVASHDLDAVAGQFARLGLVCGHSS